MRTIASSLLSLILAFLLSSAALIAGDAAAGSGRVHGIVVDEAARHPMQFVNVTVRKKSDSSLVTGMVTDKKGAFDITGIAPGEYFLRFSLISYTEKTTASFVIDQRRNSVNIGTVRITESSVKMDEVVVTSQKAMLNSAIDRKVYNVDQDVMSKAGSASELLQNVPSIEVDIDGNVSLRGSTNVMILINGKTSPLMEKSSATVLQQMPASSIEKIEVITNPSAKYKPDGTSGIINIVLKKNTSLGLNGALSANGGNNDRANGNIRLNYSPGDYNIFASYSIRKDNRNRVNSDARQQTDALANLSFYHEDLLSFARPVSNMVSLGGDYKFDEANSAGASGNYFYNTFTRTENSVKTLRDVAGVPTNRYGRDRIDYEFEKESGYSMFFEHVFSGEEHKFRMEWHASQSPEKEDNHYTDVYWFPAAPNQFDNTVIKQGDNKKELSAEYSNPLGEHTKFEAGYLWELNQNTLDFFVENFDTTQQAFVTDLGKTNLFLYDESIHAMYATFEQSFGKFGFLGGLRGEQAYLTSNLVTLNTTIKNDYFRIFPTLHLSYQFSDEAELQLNYSRRTRRPEADDLDPFPEYRDAQNLSAGNPKLLPEYINSVELGCKLQNDQFTVLPSVYYRYTTNRMTSVTQVLNDSTLLTTKMNLATDQSAGVEMIVSASIGDVVTSHISGNAYYSQIDASNLGYSANKSTVTWSGAFTANVHLTQSSMMQLNSNYSSARLTPQGEYRPSYAVNIGLRQELMDGKVSLVATMADIFKTQRREYELTTPLLTQTVINARDSRIFYIGFTYHFGAPAKKSKDDALKYDEGI
jgi:outer membrane receptor protein involved in Fe transport